MKSLISWIVRWVRLEHFDQSDDLEKELDLQLIQEDYQAPAQEQARPVQYRKWRGINGGRALYGNWR
jgi:hypothetical protein